MKKLILTLILAVLAMPALAEEKTNDNGGILNTVEAEYVCMVNDTAFDRLQIPVEVDDKTYYGCCMMCKEKLKKDASLRSALDPVSGQTVDKAEAVIGAGPDRKVHYFENEDNLVAYGKDPAGEKEQQKGDGDI